MSRTYSMKDGARERIKRALEDGNDAKANDIAIEYEFSSEELKFYTSRRDQEERRRNPYEADRLQQLRSMQAEEILALAKQTAPKVPPTKLISCEHFLGALHAHYKIHERQWPKLQQIREDSRFEIIDSKAYGELRDEYHETLQNMRGWANQILALVPPDTPVPVPPTIAKSAGQKQGSAVKLHVNACDAVIAVLLVLIGAAGHAVMRR